MKNPAKRFLITALLATLAGGAMAQTPSAAPADGKPMAHGGMAKRDPAKMQEMRAKRMAELKQKLGITAAQEGAWTAWTASMQPAGPMARPNHEEVAKLTTPERIDKMKATHNERHAQMEKRAESTKTFYAALTPEQKKVFDAETARIMGGRGPGGHGGMGGMHHKG